MQPPRGGIRMRPPTGAAELAAWRAETSRAGEIALRAAEEKWARLVGSGVGEEEASARAWALMSAALGRVYATEPGAEGWCPPGDARDASEVEALAMEIEAALAAYGDPAEPFGRFQ